MAADTAAGDDVTGLDGMVQPLGDGGGVTAGGAVTTVVIAAPRAD